MTNSRATSIPSAVLTRIVRGRAALDVLLGRNAVTRVIVHSINPEVARGRADTLHVRPRAKLAWAHDPIYDEPNDFAIERDTAREVLALPADARIALFFGTFARKKGADLLARVARAVPAVTFVFAGAGASTVAAGANVVVVDGELDYAVAARYFRACDLVVLPYRRDYEDDTSGVFVQAVIAERPVLAPAISPFRETVAAYELGATFECENVGALAIGVAGAPEVGAVATGCARYRAEIEPWSHLARLVEGPR